MILFKKANDLHKWLETQRKNDSTIGFAPTMGALHNGHMSLVASSRKQHRVTVVSIFINPTQFNDPSDFRKYLVTLEKDIEVLEAGGCDVLFLPSIDEIYPEGLLPAPYYELGDLETILEGKYRPGHFQGVCRVVHRLLDIVGPHHIYIGQKDYQQCMVIKRLTVLTANTSVKVNINPTLRESDGLAMSSRNMRLSETERKTATGIYHCLMHIKRSLKPGPVKSLLEDAGNMLTSAGFKPDYVVIADADDLAEITDWDGQRKVVALVAACLNEVRLIDNMMLN